MSVGVLSPEMPLNGSARSPEAGTLPDLELAKTNAEEKDKPDSLFAYMMNVLSDEMPRRSLISRSQLQSLRKAYSEKRAFSMQDFQQLLRHTYNCGVLTEMDIAYAEAVAYFLGCQATRVPFEEGKVETWQFMRFLRDRLIVQPGIYDKNIKRLYGVFILIFMHADEE